MDFDYFYGRDTDKFSYYMLPKILIKDEVFRQLSAESKILYACLLERTSLSFKNRWIDEENRVYIFFTIEEIMKTLCISNKTAIKIMNELDKDSGGIGLIERKKQGLGKPNIIYVKDFMSVFSFECKSYTSEVKKLHSRDVESTLQEVKEVHRTNNKNNKLNNRKPNYSYKPMLLGRFQNINLTQEEVEELRIILGGSLESYIERLSSYMKSTGKKYKDHKVTIILWFEKDKRIPNKSNIFTEDDYERGEHL